jgi:hypothetical protein
MMAELIAYAARTGTKRNLAGLRELGWRLLISAAGAIPCVRARSG